MASRWGLVGDIDNVRSEIRRKAEHAKSIIHNLLMVARENSIGKDDGLSNEKVVEMLLEAQGYLTEVTTC